MEIIILADREAVTSEVVNRIISLVKKKPHAVLGLATGNTMLEIYRKLGAAYQAGEVDFSQVTTFNLDEYIGIAPEDPRSFHSYMIENLFRHINIPPENRFIPPSQPENIERDCYHYEERIKERGGIDLQLLGIGREGHIGFNEPSSSLQARTRVKTLTDVTRRDNFGEEGGPRFALTMGIGTIMEARQIIMAAFGGKKAETIAAAVEGPVSASCPASALQFHPLVKFIMDVPASHLLKRKDYYQWIWEHKQEVENEVRPRGSRDTRE